MQLSNLEIMELDIAVDAAKLLIDDELVLDNVTKQVYDKSFFFAGTPELLIK
jgi:hypothetical protein